MKIFLLIFLIAIILLCGIGAIGDDNKDIRMNCTAITVAAILSVTVLYIWG